METTQDHESEYNASREPIEIDSEKIKIVMIRQNSSGLFYQFFGMGFQILVPAGKINNAINIMGESENEFKRCETERNAFNRLDLKDKAKYIAQIDSRQRDADKKRSILQIGSKNYPIEIHFNDKRIKYKILDVHKREQSINKPRIHGYGLEEGLQVKFEIAAVPIMDHDGSIWIGGYNNLQKYFPWIPLGGKDSPVINLLTRTNPNILKDEPMYLGSLFGQNTDSTYFLIDLVFHEDSLRMLKDKVKGMSSDITPKPSNEYNNIPVALLERLYNRLYNKTLDRIKESSSDSMLYADFVWVYGAMLEYLILASRSASTQYTVPLGLLSPIALHVIRCQVDRVMYRNTLKIGSGLKAEFESYDKNEWQKLKNIFPKNA